jgi:hypothetical protein
MQTAKANGFGRDRAEKNRNSNREKATNVAAAFSCGCEPATAGIKTIPSREGGESELVFASPECVNDFETTYFRN